MQYRNYETGVIAWADTDARGNYSIPSLAPGIYALRAEGPGYQAREIQQREVYVAARLELNFTLRPLNEVLEKSASGTALLPDQSAILPVLGPDLELGRSAPLEATEAESEVRQPSLSYVIDPKQISQAPLSARNVYSLLVTLPGVTASQVSGRGLQISANGQRPSASNYLLDGVQNNDFVNTGPFTATAPEAIQEYRVSTNNYSAEYGQTGGFIANAVTRRGGNGYHGIGYGYIDNEALDSNTFWNNANSEGQDLFPRNAFKQLYAGYSAAGPILRDRLFFSSAFEQLRSRSTTNPTAVAYLIPAELRTCNGGASNAVIDLYSQFPVRNPALNNEIFSGPQCQAFGASVIRKPVSVDRSIALERLDYQTRDGRNRLMGRFSLLRTTQPDYVYSIYQGLSESLIRNTNGVAVGYVRTLGPSLTSDLRLGWSSGRIDASRPHPEIPLLGVAAVFSDNTPATPVFGEAQEPFAFNQQSYELPSASKAIEFGMKGGQFEINEGFTWTHGRHAVNWGGGVLLRRPRYLLSYMDQGLYYFGSAPGICFGACPPSPAQNFATATPVYYQLMVNRIDALKGQYVPLPPQGYNNYSNNEFSGYFQDNIRLTQRLVLNLGVRYESYGSLLNTSQPQTFVEPGQGQSIEQRLAAATLVSESRSAYRPARNDWGGRFGVAYNVRPGTVLRGGFGIFYDRPFDNLFLDARNAGQLVTVKSSGPINFSQTPRDLFLSGQNKLIQPDNTLPPTIYLQLPDGSLISAETQYQGIATLADRVAYSEPLELLWIDRNLRTPYVQSWFTSVQQQIGSSFQLEVNHSGALARKLISNDLVNRLTPENDGSTFVRLNPTLDDDILYRSNSGASDYLGLSVLARYRSSHILAQAAYTYSHSIDNISDPLLSDAFNLASTNLDTVGGGQSFGVFTRQFDSRADRGSSDFDTRHNLVFYSIWDLPAMRAHKWLERVTENWMVAETASIRSGLPFTIYSSYVELADGVPVLVGARADVTNPALLHSSLPAQSGKYVVNTQGLSVPQSGQIGNLGRNALQGPGFWNVDLSVARSFALSRLGEAGRIQVAASAFNAFNHSNLGFPGIYDGLALYGPLENQTEFPAALPLFPTPRRIQLQLKILF